jgi:thiol-disulfide isomerase/thioredoxin
MRHYGAATKPISPKIKIIAVSNFGEIKPTFHTTNIRHIPVSLLMKHKIIYRLFLVGILFTAIYVVPLSRALLKERYLRNLETGLAVGQRAPELALPNQSGGIIKLSSLRGNMVLVEFWASWCAPCRAKNPALVAAYDKHRVARFKSAKAFKVYSVSLDKDVNSWKNAIEQDGLDWPDHVSDLGGWKSPAVELYEVRGIPANWLIDQDGVIVAHNIATSSLDRVLARYVSK